MVGEIPKSASPDSEWVFTSNFILKIASFDGKMTRSSTMIKTKNIKILNKNQNLIVAFLLHWVNVK